MANDRSSRRTNPRVLDELTEATGKSPRIVRAGENGAGAVTFDDLGQPRWKWRTEMQGAPTPMDQTFDYLKALSNDAISMENPPPSEPSKESGFDPYETVRIRRRDR